MVSTCAYLQPLTAGNWHQQWNPAQTKCYLKHSNPNIVTLSVLRERTHLNHCYSSFWTMKQILQLKCIQSALPKFLLLTLILGKRTQKNMFVTTSNTHTSNSRSLFYLPNYYPIPFNPISQLKHNTKTHGHSFAQQLQIKMTCLKGVKIKWFLLLDIIFKLKHTWSILSKHQQSDIFPFWSGIFYPSICSDVHGIPFWWFCNPQCAHTCHSRHSKSINR